MEELSETSNQNPYKVPEGYFDNLAERIMSKVTDTQASKPILKQKPVYYALAAAIILTLAFMAVMLFQSRSTNFKLNLTGITFDDVFNENTHMLDEINEEMLIFTLIENSGPDENLLLYEGDVNIATEGEAAPTNDESNEIIDYLLNENYTNELLF